MPVDTHVIGRKPYHRPGSPTPETYLALSSAQASAEAAPRSLINEVSIGTGVEASQVQHLLDRQAPVVAALRQYQRDHFLSGWQYFYLRTLAEVQATWEKMKWGERRDAAVIMGIATQRAMEVAGEPVMVLAGVHEHRHSFPALAGVLAEVARRLDMTTVDAMPVSAMPLSRQ